MQSPENVSGGAAVEFPEHRKVSVRSLNAVFRKLEDSKAHVIDRIRNLRYEAKESVREKDQLESELKNRISQTAGSEDKIKALEEEVASLRSELDIAREMLEEIDKTLT